MYGELSTELQDIIYFNYEYSANFFFLLFVIAVSCFYIFYYKKNLEPKTNLISFGIMRFFLTVVAYITTFLTPFFIYFLNPSISDNWFVQTYIILYWVYITMLLLIFLIDFIRYAPLAFLKAGGMDFDDPDVDKLLSNVKTELRKVPFIRNGIRK